MDPTEDLREARELLDSPAAGDIAVLASLEGITDTPGITVVGATEDKTIDTTVLESSSGVTVDEEAESTVPGTDAVDTDAGASVPGRDTGAPVDTDAGATVPVGSSTEAVETTITGSTDATAKSVPSVPTLIIVAGAAVAKEPASVVSVSAS